MWVRKMKLIDIDEVDEIRLPEDLFKPGEDITQFLRGTEWLAKALREEWPSADPVHAAGACYCKECAHSKDCIGSNGKGLFCSIHKGDWPSVQPDDFCSLGQLLEAGNG